MMKSDSQVKRSICTLMALRLCTIPSSIMLAVLRTVSMTSASPASKRTSMSATCLATSESASIIWLALR